MKSFLSKHIIVRFLDGKLSPEEEKELLSRKTVVSRMKQQWDSQKGDVSGFDRQKVLQQIESKIEAPAMPRRRTIRIAMWSAAASILILLGVGYFGFLHNSSPASEVKMLVYETRNKERLQVTLPDSTKVWLNAGSRLECPEVFEPGFRQVKLSGEAYFDVVRRVKQPFYVQTNKLRVSVLGTQFTVSDYQHDTSAETVLISGKVNVNVLSDSIKRAFELSPNEQLIFDGQQHATTIQTVAASQWAEWINGRLYFDNAELGFIINSLEHWYGKKIECSRELGALYRLTFTVRNESMEQTVRLMQSIAPISFRETTDGIFQVATTQQIQ